MADTEYFSVGDIVGCTTCHGQKVQGEVLAFDTGTKMLILKTTASSAKPELNNVEFVNLNFISDVRTIKPATSSPPPLTTLNYSKLSSRSKVNIEDKMRRIEYVGIGVSTLAQRLLSAITKTIAEVRWNGDDIVVWDTIIISPPYGVDDCHVKSLNQQTCKDKDGQSLGHVKKIVGKFHSDYKEKGFASSSSSSSSPTTVA